MVYFINIQHQLSHPVWQALSEIGYFDVTADMSQVVSELFAVCHWLMFKDSCTSLIQSSLFDKIPQIKSLSHNLINYIFDLPMTNLLKPSRKYALLDQISEKPPYNSYNISITHWFSRDVSNCELIEKDR